MIDVVIETNEGTASTPRNGHLDGVPAVLRPTFHAKKYKYYWRWYDDPSQEPQFLCEGVVNQVARIPFDTQDRDVIIMEVAFDKYGRPNVTHPREGATFLFTKNAVATLVSAVFSAGTVTLTIANNGGSGNINIRRRTGTDAFVAIASVAPSTTTTTDTTITLNGDYDYDLTQDGLLGSSNIKTITASGISGGGGTGTTPDGFGVTTDAPDGFGSVGVHCSWTNHGGTGDKVVEISFDFGSTYDVFATEPSPTATTHDDAINQLGVNKTYYLRVRDTSVLTPSNAVPVFIPRFTG